MQESSPMWREHHEKKCVEKGLKMIKVLSELFDILFTWRKQIFPITPLTLIVETPKQ